MSFLQVEKREKHTLLAHEKVFFNNNHFGNSRLLFNNEDTLCYTLSQ